MNKETNIVFTGDFSFSGHFQEKYLDDKFIDKSILDFLNNSDACILNYESPITPYKVTKKRRLHHRTNPEALDYIKAKFKNPILSFANNHMKDYENIGLIDTLELVEENQIKYIGAGRSKEEATRFEIIGKDVKVGVIAIQYKKLHKSINNFMGPFHEDMIEELAERITEMKKKVNWVVLVYHGGDEFLFAPMPYTRKLFKKFIKLGVDVVVGHHPHVVQGYEYFNNKPIFYSLGNFAFDTDYQRIQEGTENGILLKLTFKKDKVLFDDFPILINREKAKIEQGVKNPYFCDLGSKKYGAIWSYEAMRKKKILKIAADLKEKELEDFNIDETPKKTLFKRVIQYSERKLIKEKEATKKSLLLKLGRIKYKLFYNKKDFNSIYNFNSK